MTRGQIELWMLTKMAMLFFLVGLALVLTNFVGQEKRVICSSQAQSVARSIAGSITQVVNAPAEDERKVFPLEPVLSIGSSEYSRYTIYLVDRQEPDRKFISVVVQGRDRDCVGTDSAPYPNAMISGSTPGGTGLRSGATGTEGGSDAHFPIVRGTLLQGAVCACTEGTYQGEGCLVAGNSCSGGDPILQVAPSIPEGLPIKRAYYLIALKCKEKEPDPGQTIIPQHLFIQACTQEQPNDCIGFTSEGIKEVCDWS